MTGLEAAAIYIALMLALGAAIEIPPGAVASSKRRREPCPHGFGHAGQDFDSRAEVCSLHTGPNMLILPLSYHPLEAARWLPVKP